MTDNIEYGPLRFLIGTWESEGLTGQNQAPDANRDQENTKFRQMMEFTPIGAVENHEQVLYALRYHTKAWEEGQHGPGDAPFHEEVGYFIWDKGRQQVAKSFIVPRGIAVNAGGDANLNSDSFTMTAILGSKTYGLCSNPFLDEEFQTVRYDITFEMLDENRFKYFENTQIKIKGREKIFDHTESNVLVRKS